MDSGTRPYREGRLVLTVQEILDKEDYVVCDSSVKHSYLDEIFDSGSFSEIPNSVLNAQLASVQWVLKLLEDSKIVVPSSVAREFRNARDIMGWKFHYLSLRSRKHLRDPERPFGHRDDRRKENESKKRKLQQIQSLHHVVYEFSRINSFSPAERGKYNFLEGIVLKVADLTDAKVKPGTVYLPKDPEAKKQNNTDEKVVATAVYLSCVEGKHGAILTRDSDLKRILRNTLFYLGRSSQEGYRGVYDLLKTNSIALYHLADDFNIAELVTRSSWMLPVEITEKITQERIRVIDSELPLSL